MSETQIPYEYDVFLSYKSQERARVGMIAKELRKLDFKVWYDQNLPIGKKYDEQIGRALEASRVIVVCWSALASQSAWVLKEAEVALRLGRLVPLKFDETPQAESFATVQAADLSAWNGQSRDREWLRLLRAICEYSQKGDLWKTLEASVRMHGDFSHVLTSFTKTKAALTVSPDGSAQYRTIQEALNNAYAGATIEIFEARYPEALVITKPVELVGRASGVSLPIIDGGPSNAIVCATNGGVKVKFIKIQNAGEGHAAVRVNKGSLQLYSAEINAKNHSCVLARGDASVHIEDCLMRSRAMSALHCAESAKAQIVITEILGSVKPAVAVTQTARVEMSNCHLHDIEQTAVLLVDNASGRFDGNLIQRTGGSGFSVRGHARAEIVKNKIQQVQGYGVRVIEDGWAEAAENEVISAAKAGFSVEDQATLRQSNNSFVDCAPGVGARPVH